VGARRWNLQKNKPQRENVITRGNKKEISRRKKGAQARAFAPKEPQPSRRSCSSSKKKRGRNFRKRRETRKTYREGGGKSGRPKVEDFRYKTLHSQAEEKVEERET